METFYKCDKFVTYGDKYIYNCDNIYLYNKLNDLGSQAVIHLQLHTADSLSNIMYAMCNQRRARLQGVIDTFN